MRNPAARYRLAKDTGKTCCPKCGQKRFRRYIDTFTGELLPEEVGVCDRENSCGYLFTAMDYIRQKGGFGPVERKPLPPPEPDRTDWRVPPGKWEKTMGPHTGNNQLYMYMRGKLGMGFDVTWKEYRVGTFPSVKSHERWANATVFWLFNINGELVNGKLMHYNGFRRNKDVSPGWISNIVTGKKAKEIGATKCLFGEHLLAVYPDAKVALVESEKTALVGRFFYPDVVWLATGGSGNLTGRMMVPLNGRKVFIFPDAGTGFTQWNKLADKYEPLFSYMHISSICESEASEEERFVGIDIADMLIEGRLIDDEFVVKDVAPSPAWVKDGSEPPITNEERIDEFNKHYAPPDPVPSPQTKDQVATEIIDRMVAANPAISGLIDALDLDIANPTIS